MARSLFTAKPPAPQGISLSQSPLPQSALQMDKRQKKGFLAETYVHHLFCSLLIGMSASVGNKANGQIQKSLFTPSFESLFNGFQLKWQTKYLKNQIVI